MQQTTSRRAILAGIAAIPVAALPAIVLAASSSLAPAMPNAALGRLEQMVDTLRTRFVCDCWHPNGLDEPAAARALTYFRAGCPEASNEDFAEREAAFDFISSHGQSLDWIIEGDPRGLVCRAAARSTRAQSLGGAAMLNMTMPTVAGTLDAELAALEIKIMAAVDRAQVSGPVHTRAEDAMFAWEDCNPKPKRGTALWNTKRDAAKVACHFDEAESKWQADCDELRDLGEEIASLPAMTAEGIKIKRRIVKYKSRSRTATADCQGLIADSIKRDIRMQRVLAAAAETAS